MGLGFKVGGFDAGLMVSGVARFTAGAFEVAMLRDSSFAS